MIKLIKNANGTWTVQRLARDDYDSQQFPNIEATAELLLKKYQVADEDIDAALIQLYGMNHTIAEFDASGAFVISKEK